MSLNASGSAMNTVPGGLSAPMRKSETAKNTTDDTYIEWIHTVYHSKHALRDLLEPILGTAAASKGLKYHKKVEKIYGADVASQYTRDIDTETLLKSWV